MAYLHSDLDALEQLTLLTAEHFGYTAEYVLKDYFAMTILREITARNPQLVFKGGTCLSKCYRAIDRFSEDVDLGIS